MLQSICAESSIEVQATKKGRSYFKEKSFPDAETPLISTVDFLLMLKHHRSTLLTFLPTLQHHRSVLFTCLRC
jgi:hypothetical protein